MPMQKTELFAILLFSALWMTASNLGVEMAGATLLGSIDSAIDKTLHRGIHP